MPGQMGYDPEPTNNIDAYVNMLRSTGGMGMDPRSQFLSADYLKKTDAGTMQNNLASVYNTYGPPQGQFNAFDKNAAGGYDDPAVGLLQQFLGFRDNYRKYLEQKAPQMMQAFEPYLGGGGGQVQTQAGGGPNPNAMPPSPDPYGHYGALNPYYNPAVR